MDGMYNDMLGQPLQYLRWLERNIQEEMDLKPPDQKPPADNKNVAPQQQPNAETPTGYLKSLDSNQLHTINKMVQRTIQRREKEHPEEMLVEPIQPPLARLDEEQLSSNYHLMLNERDHRQQGHAKNDRPECFEHMADISDESLEQLINDTEVEFTKRGLAIPVNPNCMCGACGYFRFDRLEDIYPPSERLRLLNLRYSSPCEAFKEVKIRHAILEKWRMPGVNVPADLSNSDDSSNSGDRQQQDGSPPAEDLK
jgi:hypothetical protein